MNFRLNNLSISLRKQGTARNAKASFPLRYGNFSVISTPEFEFVYNLNGEIKFIRGLGTNWPHPAEQLKRTDGNDWVYYTVGDESGDRGVVSWTGEYYLPCLPYPSNPVWEIDYRTDPRIMSAFAAWSQLYADLHMTPPVRWAHPVRHVIRRILNNDEQHLHERLKRLTTIIGERVSVLPPDSRHVDYEVIPLIIADGCLYHCSFCCVQSNQSFKARSRSDIIEQISRLKAYYSSNLENYHALFLGNHDALAAGIDHICMAALEAVQAFGMSGDRDTPPSLFMFGSVDSLIRSDAAVFEKIDRLPFYTYINVGFESLDDATLAYIGKPVKASKVGEAFQKMNEINCGYDNVEISGNFLLGEQLPPEHDHAIINRLQDMPRPSKGKGTLYLSPLQNNPKRRELLPRFYDIKTQSPLPAFIYLIQRL